MKKKILIITIILFAIAGGFWYLSGKYEIVEKGMAPVETQWHCEKTNLDDSKLIQTREFPPFEYGGKYYVEAKEYQTEKGEEYSLPISMFVDSHYPLEDHFISYPVETFEYIYDKHKISGFIKRGEDVALLDKGDWIWFLVSSKDVRSGVGMGNSKLSFFLSVNDSGDLTESRADTQDIQEIIAFFLKQNNL